MGNRLSKIYTRTGDDGTTGLGDGTRVNKEHARVEAYGTVDEANSAIGMVLAIANIPESIRQLLNEVQHDLLDLGGELATPGMQLIKGEHTLRIEQAIDQFNADLPALKEFILPSGGPATSACHLARTITRRAERRVWMLTRIDAVSPEVPRYLNRLSDLLFVLARVLARHENGSEVLWQRERG
ncbi:MAG: cob(I)yrinic acid a,c-diamide adenosyltransferase [Candidatus Obscuribacterales bacterium]|nr:cob(I)yrinic acid a,c-diamide adenosyltransferase [Steroidobacteraceae bacterium]